MFKLIVTFALAVTMAGNHVATAASTKDVRADREHIDRLIDQTWYMQRVMGSNFSPTTRSYRKAKSYRYVRWVKHHWIEVRNEVRARFHSPPHYSEFLCIHHYEGSWSDSGSPYYGGLQMDIRFQHTYGRWLLRSKGTADHWTPLEQIWTAEKAERSRGFWPWPNTARYCNLL